MVDWEDFTTPIPFKIIVRAGKECKRQSSGELSVANLVYAWMCAHGGDDVSVSDILTYGTMVEPEVNKKGVRTTPVRFANFSFAMNAASVPAALVNLCESQENLTTDEFVKEFLDIHPFADGNGRVAWLLYNLLNGTLDDPVTLPNYYGETD